MSTYVLMKVLESAPSRYDKGIKMLTLGRLEKSYDRLSNHIQKNWKVLDIGCGTGALTLRAARKGALVKGVDINPQMLAIAEKQAKEPGLEEKITFSEAGAAELSEEPAANYDAVISGLCFSELSEDELKYTLREAFRMLRPGGLLLIGDEIRPPHFFKRWLNAIIRIPLVAITYILTQTTTDAVNQLPEKVKAAGFEILDMKMNGMETFIELVAQKPSNT